MARERRRGARAARRSSATRAARELAGELAEAARAWRELAASATRAATSSRWRGRSGGSRRCYELKGDREGAFAARALAAEAYAANGRPAEAAVEQLAMANQRRLAARHGEAIELARAARAEAEPAGRLDLRIRAVGLEGIAHGQARRLRGAGSRPSAAASRSRSSTT